jgi:hypothetical protein
MPKENIIGFANAIAAIIPRQTPEISGMEAFPVVDA